VGFQPKHVGVGLQDAGISVVLSWCE